MSRATGINFAFLHTVCFFYSQKCATADVHFVNHQGPRFQLKTFLTVLLKKKVIYILNGLRVSKLTANVHFWVNYPFNTALGTPFHFHLNTKASENASADSLCLSHDSLVQFLLGKSCSFIRIDGCVFVQRLHSCTVDLWSLDKTITWSSVQ